MQELCKNINDNFDDLLIDEKFELRNKLKIR